MSETVYKRLLDAIGDLRIIDAHEHLPPERVRVAKKVDALTFFSHYTRHDLFRSGMTPAEYESLFDHDMPLQQRWATVAPHWENIKFTGYGRSVRLAAEKFYGCTNLSADTIEELSHQMQVANQPGIYHKVLRETCKIEVCLTQFQATDTDSELLIPIVPGLGAFDIWENLHRPRFAREASLNSLDDYLDEMRRYLHRSRDEGAIGIKIWSWPYGDPDRKAALELFEDLRRGTVKEISQTDKSGKPIGNPLRDYVLEETLKEATALDFTVCVHAGYWDDFRAIDPLNMIPVLQRHPETRFDVYHLGYPWVRETLMLGKGFSNVWLNLCWLYIISTTCATAALDEAIDLLPANKLIGFGGDYVTPVEKVYGHLVMARETIATVLAKRVVAGQMSEEEALTMARGWLWDNPRKLYRLESRF